MDRIGSLGEWGRWLTSWSFWREARSITSFMYLVSRRYWGQQVTASTELPPLDEEAQLILDPEEILEVCERKFINRVIREYLFRWRHMPMEDATWENEQILQQPNLQLLEDNQFREGRTVMSLSE